MKGSNMKNITSNFMFDDLKKTTQMAESAIHYDDSKLILETFNNAMIVPGEGVFSRTGEYINGTSVHSEWPHDETKPQEYEELDDTVIYLGVFHPCWGHCITDNLQRLWIFLEQIKDEQYKNLSCVYTCLKSRPCLPNNFWQMLEVLGVDRKCLKCLDKTTKFSKVIIPQSCFRLDVSTKLRKYTKEYSNLIETIIRRCQMEELGPSRSIYLSRVKWNNAYERGEIRVQKVFQGLKYEIISPEVLNFKSMVALLSSSKRFASTDGSCAHNAVFCPKDAEVVIVRKASYINGYQPVINEVRDLNVTYIDANCSNILWDKKSPWSGPFFLYVNDNLARYAGVKPSFPFFEYSFFFVYVLYRKILNTLSQIKHSIFKSKYVKR